MNPQPLDVIAPTNSLIEVPGPDIGYSPVQDLSVPRLSCLSPLVPRTAFNLCLLEGVGHNGSLLGGSAVCPVSLQTIATQHSGSGSIEQTIDKVSVCGLPNASDMQSKTLPGIMGFQSIAGNPFPDDGCQPVGLRRSPGSPLGAGDLVVRGTSSSHQHPGDQGKSMVSSTPVPSVAQSPD